MNNQKIRNQVKEILFKNVNEGYSKYFKVNYSLIQPSIATYPFQYFWDTCLHVFILTALNECELAKKNMLSLFAVQRDDGFVGHIIYWDRIKPGVWTDIFQSKPDFNQFRPHMSALIQPPIVAQAVERIYDETKDKEFLKIIVPKLCKYFDWLAENRDFDGNGLLSIIAPFESGMDWKPTYDPVVGFRHGPANKNLKLRIVLNDVRNFLHGYNLEKIRRSDHFNVKDVGFNTIYAQNLTALARLCKVIKYPEANRYSALSKKVQTTIVEKMYDEADGAFYDLTGSKSEKIKILTPTIFFPIVLRDLPKSISKKVLDKHFFNKDEFDLKFPIPSVAKNDPSFDPGESLFLWRGPTWVVFNWFVFQCLYYRGFKKEAHKLSSTIKQLVKQSGFREYYNPLTGEGHGAPNFTWSGLVVDMLNLEEKDSKVDK